MYVYTEFYKLYEFIVGYQMKEMLVVLKHINYKYVWKYACVWYKYFLYLIKLSIIMVGGKSVFDNN